MIVSDAPWLITRDLRIGYDYPLCQVPDLSLGAGKRIRIAAPNGLGKTTLYQTLLGHTPPLSGSFSLSQPACFVPATNALPDVETVQDVLMVWQHVESLESSGARSLDQTVQHLGLVPLANTPLSHLSSGQSRRLALSRALASSSPILILDEPFAGIDQGYVALISQLLAQHASTKLLVYTAHDRVMAHSVDVGLEPFIPSD